MYIHTCIIKYCKLYIVQILPTLPATRHIIWSQFVENMIFDKESRIPVFWFLAWVSFCQKVWKTLVSHHFYGRPLMPMLFWNLGIWFEVKFFIFLFSLFFVVKELCSWCLQPVDQYVGFSMSTTLPKPPLVPSGAGMQRRVVEHAAVLHAAVLFNVMNGYEYHMNAMKCHQCEMLCHVCAVKLNDTPQWNKGHGFVFRYMAQELISLSFLMKHCCKTFCASNNE